MRYFLLVLALFFFTALPAQAGKAYERVVKSGTITCGYFTWAPFLVKDPNTGILSGPFVDVVEKIGKKLSLKIDWKEEIDFNNMFEGFRNGRYDVICGPLFPTPARALGADFTVPLGYAPTYLYARTDDKRFDNKYEMVNKPETRISIIEGEFSQIVANEKFPAAKKVTAMNIDGTQTFMDVTTNKSDIVASEPTAPYLFQKSNPGKLKRVEGGPIHTGAFSLATPIGEYELTRMLDIAIDNMAEGGEIEKLMTNGMPEEIKFIYPSKP
ncbi:MAG: transporter substrate-binding domain-containing protein [Alphaproteobacteria bacterium]|nr:transporter substrate-binding domain-containing protein [Alphaproteobacteria bacterium]